MDLQITANLFAIIKSLILQWGMEKILVALIDNCQGNDPKVIRLKGDLQTTLDHWRS